MQAGLEMVQFTVARLEDIRTLLLRWRQVLAELEEAARPSMVMQTYRGVGVELQHRRPGMESF
jgi:hypothetical protein